GIGITMPRDGVEVIARGVALMAVEPVARVDGVERQHRAVARDLGHDRRRRNGGAPGVAVDDGPLGHRKVGNAEGVHQHHVGQRHAGQDGPLHRPQRRLMDVDAVDFGGIDEDHRPPDPLPRDAVVQALALERGHGLRVADAGDVAVGIEHDRRRHHGTREAAASHFVDACHVHEPHAPERILQGPVRAHLHYAVCFLPPVSFMRAALPFRSRRKYSFARRTFAVRSTSILSMTGECSGKIRSTPWPNDTLRTVNVARAPPRCIPITMPSNTWMRSLSPSRTFTCTFTVSPGLIAGRLASCPRSTVSTAFMTFSPCVSSHIGGDPCTPPSSPPSPRASSPPPPPSPANPARVRASAASRRHFSLSAWCPDSSTGGTPIPRNSAGRVYCGKSSSPSRANVSPATDDSSPTTPGTSRATASTMTSAGSSPPDTT